MKSIWIKFGVVGLMCLLLALVPLLGACAPKPAPAPPKPKVTIKLGGMFDFTSRAAYEGEKGKKVWEDFLKWFQEEPKPEGYGGIPGVELKVVYYDFAFEAEKGRIGAKKLITEDNVVIGAPFWGSMSDALVHPMQMEYGIPCISLGALSAVLWPAEGSWTFNSYYGYNDQPRNYIDLILKRGKPAKLALLYEDSPFGRSQIPFSKRYCELKGLPIAADAAFPSGTVDWTAELTRIKKAGADFIYCVTTMSQYGPMLKQLGTVAPEIPLMTPMQGYHPLVLEIGGPGAGTIYASGRFMDWFDAADPEMGKAVSWFEKLLTKYRGPDFKKDPAYSCLEFAAVNWAIASGAARAIEICIVDRKIAPEKLTGKDVKGAIESIRDFDCYVKGWQPLISWFPTDHRALRTVGLVTNKAGKWTPVTDFFGVKVPRFIPVGEMLPEEKAGKM